MCKFDSDPVWRLPATANGPDPKDYVKMVMTKDAEMEHYFPSAECQGELHAYYYAFLAISHAYFLIEFFLRALCSKA